MALARASGADEEAPLLEDIWNDTPLAAKAVLLRLMEFIEAVAQHEKQTRMTANSLCLVFAPGILRPAGEQSALDMLRDQPLSQKALMKLYEFVLQKGRDADASRLSFC